MSANKKQPCIVAVGSPVRPVSNRMIVQHCHTVLVLPPPAGVEYIISRRLYEGLPDEEKRYWHSHVYEVRRQ